MISERLKASLAKITDITAGYVFHPLAIRIAIEIALAEVHRQSVQSGDEPIPEFVTHKKRQTKQCAVAGCLKDTHANSLCHPHYKRYKRGTLRNEPLGTKIKKSRKRPLLTPRARVIKSAMVNLMGGQCMCCGGTYPPSVYDLHHVLGKDREISSLLRKGSIGAIASEVSRCALLCANCHRLEHLC